MMIEFFRNLLHSTSALPQEPLYLDAEYEPFREELAQAGLSEETLRRMDPDDRVRLLEQARLDPYDYIYLAC